MKKTAFSNSTKIIMVKVDIIDDDSLHHGGSTRYSLTAKPISALQCFESLPRFMRWVLWLSGFHPRLTWSKYIFEVFLALAITLGVWRLIWKIRTPGYSPIECYVTGYIYTVNTTVSLMMCQACRSYLPQFKSDTNLEKLLCDTEVWRFPRCVKNENLPFWGLFLFPRNARALAVRSLVTFGSIIFWLSFILYSFDPKQFMGGPVFVQNCHYVTISIYYYTASTCFMQITLALGLLQVDMQTFETQVRSHCKSCGSDEQLTHNDLRGLMVAYSAREASLEKFTETFAKSAAAYMLYLVSLVIFLPFAWADNNTTKFFVAIFYYALIQMMFIFAIPAKHIARLHSVLDDFPIPTEQFTLLLFFHTMRRIQSSKKGINFYGYLFTNTMVIQKSWSLALAAFFLYGLVGKLSDK